MEFIRPKHVAENFVDVANDEVTGSLTAVVFKARPLLLDCLLQCALCSHAAACNTRPGV